MKLKLKLKNKLTTQITNGSFNSRMWDYTTGDMHVYRKNVIYNLYGVMNNRHLTLMVKEFVYDR